jgi:hypothetical protein
MRETTTPFPGRTTRMLILLKWLGIGLLLLVAVLVLFIAFEVVRLLVDPNARA